MKLKIICIVVVFVGMHLLASSNNCTTACKQEMVCKKEKPSVAPAAKTIVEASDEELPQFSLLPFHSLLFNL
jgi:hypothetical protein